MESFLFSLGPLGISKLTGGAASGDLLTTLYFVGAMFIYTYAYLYYRCRVKTENKPPVSYKKAIAAMTPMFVYIVAIFGLSIAVSFSFNPMLILAYTLGSSILGLWIVSFFFYYPSVRVSHGDCFPSVFKSIWNFIKALIPGI